MNAVTHLELCAGSGISAYEKDENGKRLAALACPVTIQALPGVIEPRCHECFKLHRDSIWEQRTAACVLKRGKRNG